ncbi:MAG: hypothetical protein WBA22_01525 [Candidatus Methanofastidiosia archaeon]
MIWTVFTPREKKVGKILETIDYFIILPTDIYRIEKQARKNNSEKTQNIQVQGYFFTPKDRNFFNPVFASCEISDNGVMHFSVSTDSPKSDNTFCARNIEIVLMRNLFVRFIVETSMTPFYIQQGMIFIPSEQCKNLRLDALESEWLIDNRDTGLEIEKFFDQLGLLDISSISLHEPTTIFNRIREKPE